MLSTTPAYVDGRLLPRPMSLRVFLARTPARLAGDAGRLRPHRPARRSRAPSACSAAAPPPTSGWSARAGSRPSPCCRPRPRPTPASAPACCRAAPATTSTGSAATSSAPRARCGCVRAYHVRLAETADPEAPLAAHFADYLDVARPRPRGAGARRRSIAMLDSAIVSAGNVRDRFSVDGWSALNDLAKTTRRMAERVTAGRRRRPRHGRAAAQDHRLLRPRAREHVPLHRLAVPVDRPHRSSARSRWPARSPGSPTPTRPTARSTSRSRSATA